MVKAKKKEPRRAIVLGQTALSVLPPEETVRISEHFRASVNGLILDGNPPFEEWRPVGKALRILERCAPFALGDFLLLIEERLSEAASQIVDASEGWSLKTCAVYRWLAQRIPPENRRMDRLGVKHHLLVATLSHDKQREWLEKAAADDEEKPWTSQRLADALMDGEDLPPAALWVLASATNPSDQEQLMAMLEAQGRSVKALERRARRRAPIEG